MKRDDLGSGDDELPPPIDRAVFDLLVTPSPPKSFAERVVAQAPGMSSPPRRRLGRIGAGVGLLAAAAVAIFAWRAGDSAEVGESATNERRSITIGKRGVAVAEPGARLSWRAARGNVRVVQTAGGVFYRVDSGWGGSDFEVETPGGVVRVEGTCFAVEVTPQEVSAMIDKRALVSGGIGAAAAALVMVGVYEGRVRLSNAHGHVDVEPGQRAVVHEGTSPRIEVPGRGGTRKLADVHAGAGIGPPKLAALGADERQELERLREKVREMEEGGRGGGGESGPRMRKEEDFVTPTREELLERAKRCGLAWDAPPLDETKELSAREAERLGLSEAEREIVGNVRKAFSQKTLGDLRRIYVEVTGNAEGARHLSAEGIKQEVVAKSPEGEAPQVWRQLSAEKAGLTPVSTTPGSPLERMMRLLTNQGDDFEKALAAQLGPERARELRMKNNGWGNRSGSTHGCPTPR